MGLLFGLKVVVKIMVPFFGPLNTRRRIILRTKHGTIILTTTLMSFRVWHVVQAYTCKESFSPSSPSLANGLASLDEDLPPRLTDFKHFY